jgi:hypothetical protein
MALHLHKIVFTLIVLLLPHTHVYSKSYYVDAIKGSDNNNGFALSSAWKTIEKVSNTSFKPGDIISFKSGQQFIGVLSISSSGSNGAPIIYTSYGGSEPAIIDGNGDSTAIYSYNQQYLEIKNLAVTNFRSGVIAMSDLFNGIYIVNEDAGVLNHFHFNTMKNNFSGIAVVEAFCR